MDYEEISYGNNRAVSREQQMEAQLAFPALMRKVYLWMSLALIITGMASYTVASNETLMSAIFGNQIVFWVLIIGELGLVIGLSAAINRLSLTMATLMFVLYSVVNGVTLASIFFVYTTASITQVFFITAATFAVMAFIGYTTKSDLTSIGKISLMAVIGLIIASIVNIFVKSSALDLIVSGIGVLVFVGLTAYDSQKIKQMLLMAGNTGEGAQKIALLGALSLYLDFVNLFLYLLRFLGKRE